MSRFDVVVVGSLNLDLVARSSRLPGPGETVHGHDYTEVAGGKGLNQAVAAARAVARVAMIGAVGDDAAGDTLRGVVRDEGIDDSLLATVPGVPTGRALIAVDDAAENSIVVVPGANGRVVLSDVPEARVVLAQLEIDPRIVIEAFRQAREQGATTVLNPAPADRVPAELLPLCDIVIPNEHELDVLGGRAALAAAGVRTLVVTRGADGADLYTAADSDAEPEHLEPVAVDAVDTTAAGDAFCGGLAARLAGGDELVVALGFASANGALAATRHGAVPSLPTARETFTLLAGEPAVAALRGGVVGEPEPEGDDDTTAHVSDAAPESVARSYLAAFATGDPDRVAAHVTDDFVNDHAAALGSGCEGKDEYRRRLPGFLNSFDGLRYDVEHLVADGPNVAAAYRMSAKSDGHPIDIRGVMWLETRDGLVARRTDYWDALTFLRQTKQT